MLPLIGISTCERLRDRGYDCTICFDDMSKHAKSYRTISLIQSKIPSRDAYPADIFNIHSSLLERCGKIKFNYFGGSITAFPIIETINSDITEYIATNLISITDGQLYINKTLFNDSIRPAIDSSLSVSRIGSSAQCRLMKLVSLNMKNEITNLRNNKDQLNQIEYEKLSHLNLIFQQDHLMSASLESTIILCRMYQGGLYISNKKELQRLLFIIAHDGFYLSYITFMLSTYCSIEGIGLIDGFIGRLFNVWC